MLSAYVCSAFIVTYDLQGRSVSDLFVQAQLMLGAGSR